MTRRTATFIGLLHNIAPKFSSHSSFTINHLCHRVTNVVQSKQLTNQRGIISLTQITPQSVNNKSQSMNIPTDTRTLLAERVTKAMATAFGEDYAKDAMLTPATDPKFGDYQCNAAMSLSKKVKQKPRDIATKILEHLNISDMCSTPQIAGPGFINFTLTDQYLNTRLNNMLVDRSRLGVDLRVPPQRVVVDFSSPNIAKDMHVGHLRSTIIGDTIAKVLEFLGHTTIRLNHTGDWGTQFGQLITYMREERPELLSDTENGKGTMASAAIGDLVTFYRAANKRFKEDTEFKKKALAEVVQLQSGNPETLRAWKIICDLSRIEFQKIYDRLGISLTERGESFYNPFLGDIVEHLCDQGLAEKSDGAMAVFLEGDAFKGRDGSPLPVLVQKSDGGYLYATTDLAAVRYRVEDDKADRIVYVTDIGQSLHFQQIFSVARKASLAPANVSLEHIKFGIVQGADGKKFKTRAGDAPKLSELLDEARDRALAELVSRETMLKQKAAESGDELPPARPQEELMESAEIIGIASVKYADLKNNRERNYKFSFDKMVQLEGDTAPAIMYGYARVQGIYRNAAAAKGIEQEGVKAGVKFIFENDAELALARKLITLPEVLSELERDLLPHVLCDYVYILRTRFNQFYEQCPVLHAKSEELQQSRLALCQLSADTLKLCLNLLGISTLNKI